MTPAFTIRPVRDEDSEPLAALIAACFAEYPNSYFVWEEFPELRAPAAYAQKRGGRLWVAESEDGRLVGSFAIMPVPEQQAGELGKVYADAGFRGAGLAQAMFALALDHARESGFREIILWSDTRFARGHRFYEKLGFTRWPGERYLGDVSETWEYHYRLPLDRDAGTPAS